MGYHSSTNSVFVPADLRREAQYRRYFRSSVRLGGFSLGLVTSFFAPTNLLLLVAPVDSPVDRSDMTLVWNPLREARFIGCVYSIAKFSSPNSHSMESRASMNLWKTPSMQPAKPRDLDGPCLMPSCRPGWFEVRQRLRVTFT